MLPAQVFYKQMVLIVPPMRTYKLAQLRFGERLKDTTNQNEFNSRQTMQAIYFIIIAYIASYCNSIFAFFCERRSVFMPIIRRQKPKGYTVISNYMFTNDTLSLKAIGLFCYMVSRPEGWNFSERGLASQLKDGKASIASALRELKEKKYIRMEPYQKDKLGRMIGASYYLYQIPYDVDRSTLAEAVFTGDANRGEYQIEKITNYTMLSNYHLLDGMSLKAMGLLSYILNLPNDWQNFSVDFFQSKFDGGRTVVTSALKELQERKYIQIKQPRNENGLLGKSIYTIYEYPYDLFGEDPINTEFIEQKTEEKCFESLNNSIPPCPDFPHTVNRATEKQDADNPVTVKRDSGNQDAEKQGAENPPHRNIKTPNINKININKAIIKSSSSQTKAIYNAQAREEMRMKIKQHIGYDAIISLDNELEEQMENDEISLDEYNRRYIHPRYLTSIVNAMVDVYCSELPEIEISHNRTCSKYRIIENFESLTRRDIRIIVERIIENKPQNVRAYIQVIINNYL